ncbi:MAG TPA: helix-turn-helix transcriptional regulator [Nocardia sp.]|uniref:helix-turn-helix domain-containing protein n=1 Tax=Nocardia sp. TaxID=1821 RepID=UPI002B4B2442|nr:helix-turn-helix transcriptional regulator [Nocardia sp.]HLS76379.1 helix-turn-helix transcriptional regulator [Nocardia sp.]
MTEQPTSEQPAAGPRHEGHPRLHSIPGGRDERRPPPAPEPLWREVLGERLRALRLEQGATLVETARRAGISPQYLSEVERGRKEPSSEMIAAVAGALGITLIGLTVGIADDLRSRQRPTAAPARRAGRPATSCARLALGRAVAPAGARPALILAG